MDMAQAGIAGAEVVQRNAYSAHPQEFDVAACTVEVLQKCRLRELEAYAIGADAALFDDGEELQHEDVVATSWGERLRECLVSSAQSFMTTSALRSITLVMLGRDHTARRPG